MISLITLVVMIILAYKPECRVKFIKNIKRKGL